MNRPAKMNDVPINTTPRAAAPPGGDPDAPLEVVSRGDTPNGHTATEPEPKKEPPTMAASKAAPNDRRPKPKSKSKNTSRPQRNEPEHDDDVSAAHLAALERLQSQLSAARSQARAAQAEARTARSQSADLRTDLARTERLLTAVTSERDTALRSTEALRTRHATAQSHLNRELDVLRGNAAEMEGKNAQLHEHIRSLRGELYRVGLENEAARNDARLVLRSFDELRERCGEAGPGAHGAMGKKTRGGKIAAALGLSGHGGGGGRRSVVAESGGGARVAMPAAQQMQKSSGSVHYHGGPREAPAPMQQQHYRPQHQARQHFQQQQKMHHSYDSIGYVSNKTSLVTPQQHQPQRRRAGSLDNKVRQRAGMVCVGGGGAKLQQPPLQRAVTAPTLAPAPVAAAARRGRHVSSLPAASRSSSQQGKSSGRNPSYISNVREGEVAKCYTPQVA